MIKQKVKKPRPTYKELFARYYQKSSCAVSISDNDRALNIVFKGELVRIPSLKNSKIPGKNFIAPDTRARIKVMDALFAREIERKRLRVNTASVPMLLIFIAGARSGSFDLSGCIETIQDWLEPQVKKVGKKSKSRGWGVGVISNDSHIRPVAFHSHDLTGFARDESRIILIPLLEVSDGYFFDYIKRLRG